MKRAKVMAPPAPACARNAARKAGETGAGGASPGAAEPMIYNLNRMHTVRTMGKRILTLATGVALGALAVPGLLHLGLLWGLFPSRDLNHASGYVREVLQLVSENYVDAKASSYDELARSAIHGMVE